MLVLLPVTGVLITAEMIVQMYVQRQECLIKIQVSAVIWEVANVRRDFVAIVLPLNSDGFILCKVHIIYIYIIIIIIIISIYIYIYGA